MKHGRESVSISLHQNSSLPFWDYFTDLEPVFRDYGVGRTGPKSTPCGQMTCGPSIPSGMTS